MSSGLMGHAAVFLSTSTVVILILLFHKHFFFQSGGKGRKALHVPYRDSVLTWLLKVKAESVPSYNESNLKKTIHH